jgi:hypothetical protein
MSVGNAKVGIWDPESEQDVVIEDGGIKVNVAKVKKTFRFDPDREAPVYVGSAPTGSDESEEVWNIVHIESASIKQATGAWVDRTTLTYN